MLKQRIINLVVAVALLVAVVGGSGVIADELGMGVTSEAHAGSCSSGGGC